ALFYQVFHEAGVKDALKDIDSPTRIELSNHYVKGAFIHLVRKRVDLALEACGKAIAVDPRRGDPYALRAAILVFRRDFAGAEKDAARAIDLGGKDLLSAQLRSLRSFHAHLGAFETTMLEMVLLILAGGPGPSVDLASALDADSYFRSRRLEPS